MKLKLPCAPFFEKLYAASTDIQMSKPERVLIISPELIPGLGDNQNVKEEDKQI